MVDPEAIKKLLHIYVIILHLENYSEDDIDSFCKEFIIAATKLPVDTDYQELADMLSLILAQYHKSIIKAANDRGDRGIDVKIISSLKPYIISTISDFENKINAITHSDINIIEKYHFNNKSVYYSGPEQSRLNYLEELENGISLNPDFAAVLPAVTAFVAEITKKYTNKQKIKGTIGFDVSNKKALLAPLQKTLLKCYYGVCELNINDLSKVPDYFKTEIMDGRNKSPDYLYVNEYMINVLAGMLKNDPRPKFDHSEFLKAESKGLGDGMIFLSDIPNPTVIPARAKLLKVGETIEFPIADIGSLTEFYLIFAAITPGEDFILKLTVKPKK